MNGPFYSKKTDAARLLRLLIFVRLQLRHALADGFAEQADAFLDGFVGAVGVVDAHGAHTALRLIERVAGADRDAV